MVAAIDNRMIKRTVEGAPDVTYDYYYNTDWQVIEIRKDADTDPYKQFVWDARYIDAPVVRFTDGNIDGDLDDTGDNTDHTLYCTNDANMNVTALINTSGNVVERYLYDAYGRVTVLNGASDQDGAVNDWSTDADNTSDWDNHLLYCGYRHDPTLALYHVRHRVYDPELGRWLQRDPLGYVDGMGLYEYVGGKALGYLDALGLDGEPSNWQVIWHIWGSWEVGGDLSKTKPHPSMVDWDTMRDGAAAIGDYALSGGQTAWIDPKDRVKIQNAFTNNGDSVVGTSALMAAGIEKGVGEVIYGGGEATYQMTGAVLYHYTGTECHKDNFILVGFKTNATIIFMEAPWQNAKDAGFRKGENLLSAFERGDYLESSRHVGHVVGNTVVAGETVVNPVTRVVARAPGPIGAVGRAGITPLSRAARGAWFTPIEAKATDIWTGCMKKDGSVTSLTNQNGRGTVSGFREIMAKARAARAGDVAAAAEIQAAKYLRSQRVNVHFQTPGTARTADFLIGGARGTGFGGRALDVYSPITANANRIISAIAHKNSQVQGVILDLSRTSVTPDQLGNVLGRVEGAGATNIQEIIILPR